MFDEFHLFGNEVPRIKAQMHVLTQIGERVCLAWICGEYGVCGTISVWETTKFAKTWFSLKLP